MYDEVIAELQKSIALSARSLLTLQIWDLFTPFRDGKEAKKIIDDLQSEHDQDTSADAYIAMIYVGLGDHDEAMTWLNEAYEARFKASILLHPAFGSVAVRCPFPGSLAADRPPDIQKLTSASTIPQAWSKSL